MPIQDVAWALQDLDARAKHMNLCRDYYEGRHRRVIPEAKTLNRTIRDLIERLRDNLCDDVVDEPVERTSVTNWTVGGARPDAEGGGPTQASQAAADAWARNKGGARAKEVHRDHWAIGDAFVIVQRDSAQVARFYPQRPELMAIRYQEDEPDKPEVAAKCWRAGRRWRLTLYYPPKSPGGQPFVERYATKGLGVDGARPQAKAFAPVTEGMGFGPPIESLEGTRFPVYHAPAGEVGRYGRSVLDPVMPLQDVLNKSMADMVCAMEDAALPTRWGTGIQVEIDPATGQEKPLFTGKERFIRTGKPEARFGEFQTLGPAGFLTTQNTLRCEIARKGRLPLHSVNLDPGGEAPSGIALLVSEGRLVKRVKSAEDDTLEPFWREVMAHLLELQGIRVQAGDIDIEWAPAETRDEQALVETLTAKVDGLGLPKRQALIESGYDPDDVDEWLEEAQAQADSIAGGRISRVPVPPNGAPRLLPPAPPTPSGVPASGVSA